MRIRLKRKALTVLYYISFKSLIIYSYCSYTRGCLVYRHLCVLQALFSCTRDKNMCVSYYVTNLTNFYDVSSMYWKGMHDVQHQHHQAQYICSQLHERRSPLRLPVGFLLLMRGATNTKGTFHFSHEGWVGFLVPFLSQDMTTSNGNEDT